MKRLIALLFLCLITPVISRAWFRLGSGATPVTNNTGDKCRGISVTISTVSASLVVTGQPYYRETLLQNSSTAYYVICGTFSAVTSVSGAPRWFLPPKPTGFTTDGTYSIYCIVEPAALGTTIEINGSQEFEDRDRIQ